jgi:hypothetical protein
VTLQQPARNPVAAAKHFADADERAGEAREPLDLYSPHRGADCSRAIQVGPRRSLRRCRQGGRAKADRRLAEDRGAHYRSDPETGEGTEQLSERAERAEEERDLAEAK